VQAPTGPSRPTPSDAGRVEEPRELARKTSEVDNYASAGELKLDDHSGHEPLGESLVKQKLGLSSKDVHG
jgi:hypothetical protein